MISGRRSFHTLALAISAWLYTGVVAGAESVADFYRGKTIDLYIGGDAGGAYDLVGRLLSRFLGKHIPGGPAFVVKNYGAASGIPMTNFLFNDAARDGTVIGMPTNGLPVEPRLRLTDPDGRNLKFEPAKFNWIGSPTQETQVVFLWHKAAAKTLADIKVIDASMAATSPSGDTYNLPLLLNRLFGARLRIVPGYGGH